jgi:hypothetical protein
MWKFSKCVFYPLIVLASLGARTRSASGAQPKPLVLAWNRNILSIKSPAGSSEPIPGAEIRLHYIEAYCRPGSTDRDWKRTTVGHATKVVGGQQETSHLVLRCTLKDGVIVDHDIRGISSAVEFRLSAHNPTNHISQAVWGQPCLRVDRFTARNQQTYLDKCFIFVGGKLTRLPTQPWATKARYEPGQVWAPRNVARKDVNPRPLSTIVPSNGLIGCFSADEKMILATAWEPYQELFQGVVTCIHSDFHIGSLGPDETKRIRGKIYVVRADVDALLDQYRRDFAEHFAPSSATSP